MKGRFLDPEPQNKQRVIIETIAGLLPTKSRKSSVPIAFLSGLLKTVIMVSASFTCRSDLERRIGLQLDQEDILIPANPYGHNQPLYETDSILRIFSIFLNLDEDEITILKVSKLFDNYLVEIALDLKLLPSKFITLTELLPDHA
ncbi:BTB/POZ domain-containing protein isoform X1 [Cinnamomum micranthum f. kanehirae]|uniref:BTB/POZ domain-containing protein isoform X1 n=1 Tax=Cinnamomum micranthum f. kanehirae TaxID=337451 RepID=A0A443NBZ2_9MAGN|nr:BTB/POZ domain-containing protein isoform X1 [Cinnamomum micranthum f. kanehirae]